MKLIKENKDLFSHFIHHNFNNSLFSSSFPPVLKRADVLPVHKKKSKTDIENYRPISILPTLSKIYERCMYDQMYNYFNDIFSKYQCGFREGYSAQHCLLAMVEKWKESLDKGGLGGALLTDLSKAFDCIKHDLLIAKLAAYGFDKESLSFISQYLVGRTQRTKINNSYSSYSEIIYGVPQGSILGPLLFNIYICDLFFEELECDIASYADDTTPYAFDSDLHVILKRLENCSKKLLFWFKDNHLKANSDKCHLLVTTCDPVSIKVNNSVINSTKEETLLGIKFDSHLSFDTHVANLCKKASQKLHALARISHYMNLDKRRCLMNAFITSHFNYCPLIWMFHSRKLNNRINRIHERALRLTYQDNRSSFNDLLEKDSSVTVHTKNLQVLATEIFKIQNNLAPPIMKEVLTMNDPAYYFRSESSHFKQRNFKTTKYGLQSISYLAPRIWDLIPTNIKKSKTLQEFKTQIKSWYPDQCPCRLCKTYVAQIGFI